MKKFKSNIWEKLFLAITYLSFFVININVSYFGDDFSYLKWTKLNTVDYIQQVAKHYLNVNGRTIVHILDSIFLSASPVFWAMFNSLMLVFICYFAAKIITKNDKKRVPLAFSIMFFFVAILDILVTRQSVYWMTGSFNYVYPICMFFIYWYHLTKINESKKDFVCAIIFGILASASVEQMGMMTFGITVLTLLDKIRNIKEVVQKSGLKNLIVENKRICWMLMITFIGLATVVLAPGQFVRLSDDVQYSRLRIIVLNFRWILESFTTGNRALIYTIVINLIVILYNVDYRKDRKIFLAVAINLISTISINLSSVFSLTGWKLILMMLILLTYVYEIFFLNSRLENKLFSVLINAIILMVGSQFMMVISNVIGERNLLPGYIMYAFIIAYLIINIKLPKYIDEKTLTVCLILVGILFNARTAVGYYNSKMIWNENMKTIAQHRTESVITLRRFKDTNYSWSALYESKNHTKYFKQLYDITAEFVWTD